MSTLKAHPDIISRIENVSVSIKQSPKNAQLLIKRGLLYQEHQNWSLAVEDYKKAQKFGVAAAWVSFYRAGLLRAANKNDKAEALLLYSLNNSDNLKNKRALVSLSHLNLAEIKASEIEWLKAANHYLLSIQNLDKKNPGIYLSCSTAFKKAGTEHYKAAIEVLEQGIKLFPGAISLYDLAIEIEIERKRYEFAIIKLEQVLSKYPQLESKRIQLMELRQETDVNK